MTYLEMAYRLSLFQSLAYRRHLGEDQLGHTRTPEGSLEEGSSEPSAGVVDSQSVKTTAIGGEDRAYDGGKKVKGRKRHILLDTEGFVLSRPRSTGTNYSPQKASRCCHVGGWWSERSLGLTRTGG
jgi:hypothetical protein